MYFADEFQQLLAISQGTLLSSTSSNDDLTTVDETSEPSSTSEYEEEDNDEDEDNIPPRIPNRRSYIRYSPPLKEDSDCQSDRSLHTGDDPLYAVIKE